MKSLALKVFLACTSVGVLSVAWSTFAAGPLPPGVTPPKPIVLSAAPLKLKSPVRINFSSGADVQRIARAAAGLQNKKINDTPSNAPLHVGFDAQPGGFRLDLVRPYDVYFEGGASHASFPSNRFETFDATKGYESVRFLAYANRVHVIDCPVSGGPSPLYRTTVQPVGGSPVSTELHSGGPVTYLPTTHVTLTVDVQGFLTDGEEYGWEASGCQVTTFAYQ